MATNERSRPEDLTETEREALHEVELGIERLHRAHGHLVAFHHNTGRAMDHLASAEPLLDECGYPDLADELRDAYLPRGVVADCDPEEAPAGRWSYAVLEDFQHSFLDGVVAFAGITVLGGSLINPTTAAAFGSLTPPMLFSASSDIAVLRGAGITSIEFSSVVPRSVELFALVIGAGVSEFVYARWGVRINGLIAAPLLVLFSLVHPTVVPVYVVGTALVYTLITLVNRQTLLYGRVLLSTAIVLGVGLAIPAAVFGPAIPGSVLLFTAIIAGIGAYNLHRVPPRERSASALVSAGLFVGLFGAVRLAARVPRDTLPFDSVPYAAVGLFVLVLCTTNVLALERRRRPAVHTERQDRSEVPW